MILLKGHLLIEEQLQALVEALVKDSRPLGDARLTFHQWLCMGKALAPGGSGDDLWKFVERLNKTRNKLAHNAEVADFEQKVDALIRGRSPNSFPASPESESMASHPKRRFHRAHE